jgi:sulfatase maturation enzyme AslB (radical SAM superfamily)
LTALKKAWAARRRILSNPSIAAKYAARAVRERLPGPTPWPSVIYVGVNNRCNYFCEFCDIGRANLERKKIHSDFVYNLWTDHMAPFDAWKALVDDVSRFKPIIAVTTAEPLLYPKLLDLVDHVHLRGMEIWVTTNGSLLPDKAPRLLEHRLDRLQVSIDGPPEVHDKIRGVKGAFQHAMDGIDFIMRNRSGKSPYVSVNCTICDLNYDRLVETLKHVRCDEIVFSHLNFVTDEMAQAQNAATPYRATSTSISRVQLETINPDVLHEQCNELRKWNGNALVHIGPDLDREGVETHYRRHLEPHRHMSTCHAMTQVGQILADGGVTISTRCLSTIRLGKITEKPFTEIWRGKQFEDFRRYMRKVKLMPACMRCCGAL